MISAIIGIISATLTLNGVAVSLTTKRASRIWHVCRAAITHKRGSDYPATWSEPPIIRTRYAGRTWHA